MQEKKKILVQSSEEAKHLGGTLNVFRGNRRARRKWKKCMEKQNELFSEYFSSPIGGKKK